VALVGLTGLAALAEQALREVELEAVAGAAALTAAPLVEMESDQQAAALVARGGRAEVLAGMGQAGQLLLALERTVEAVVVDAGLAFT
jgi:hypothetical protein